MITPKMARVNTPNTTPRKPTNRKERWNSAPGRSRTAIYFPESTIRINQSTNCPSRSTIIYKPGKEVIQIRNGIEPQVKVKHKSRNSTCKSVPIPMQRMRQNDSERLPEARNTLPVVMNTCEDINTRHVTIFPTTHRGNTQPEVLLHPNNFQATQQHSKATSPRVHLPNEPVAKELLWLSGVVLLVTGLACCVLCFCIFSKRGRTYYTDVGTISAFVTIILGFLGLRASHWEWFPNHICVSGLLFLSCLNLIQCCVLGLMVIHWHPLKMIPQAEAAAKSVCVLSFMTVFLTFLGLSASAGCKDPPPENRVVIAV